ncbi:LPS export ABC transporter protein LptC [Arachidicoccus rhizosphaerae]|uniref:LPS export ABC transporter protein LptC n=1 Tax=Arachidicoccus rhizosphaerae TaxID=551991 RepID=A0A1H3XEE5_9BACT|nr:LPS export ABC transporter periplasmic protein LptC [Arachidicoccus rhizosphaerae]SDZ96992.1 LPS export ABC transporter protein LptC [Arachidicoccus rhizosphaerae]
MLSFTLQNLRKSCCLLLAGSLLLGGCENDINEVKALSNHNYNTEEATGVTSYLSIGGKVKAKLTAPVMVSTEKDTTSMIFPKSLFVVFYDDSTSLPTSFVQAQYGIYYKRLNKVKLRDSVIAYTIAGDTLTTSELWWDQNKELIYSDSPTVLKQTASYGYLPGKNGFHAKQDFSEFVMLNTNNGIMSYDETMGSGTAAPAGSTAPDSLGAPTAASKDSSQPAAAAVPAPVKPASKQKPAT